MSTVPAIVVDGNDLTAWLQDRSMSVKRNSLDATFIDEDGALTAIPALGDTVTLDAPAWSGTINSVVSTGYRGNVPFYKIHASNADVLPDAGTAPFALADTGSRYSSPAGFKDLEVTRILDNAVEEVRSKCIIFKEGITWGMEVAITSVVEGYTAEVFTVMELTVDWPRDDAATYTLDLGLGVFADATTGGGDGGPLDPPTLEDEIGRIAEEHCCDEGPGASVPLVTVPAECVTFTNHTLYEQDDGDGTYIENFGGSGTAGKVGSRVYNNVPYTDSDFPCPAGGGSWRGYIDEEIWLQFTAPTDDPTEYLGLTLEIDAGVSVSGYHPSYSVRIAAGAGADDRFGEGAYVCDGVTATNPFVIYVPRNLVTWGSVNAIVLHPDWLCDRMVQFCNINVSFASPDDDGRAQSGWFDDFTFPNTDVCPLILEAGHSDTAINVAGVGDVDGANKEFTLLHWDGTGSVEATVNGLPVGSAEMTLDTGAFTVTFNAPPPLNSVVLFTYHAVT